MIDPFNEIDNKGDEVEIVSIVALFALVQYLIFGAQAGRARTRYEIQAPAVVGHPVFERKLRVQQNTLEQLVVFLPSLGCFGWYIAPNWAALLGAFFIAGRFVYARSYVADPAKRSLGFGITFLAQVILLLGGLIGAIMAWWVI